MYFDAPEDAQALEVSTDLQIVLSLNSLAVLGLGLFPGGLLAVCTAVLS
jgi:NADH-quinone oxidoreductase subunit N